MALQALLFSKNPETVQALTAILAEADMRAEVCADIFSAIEKAKKHPFACVIADWVDQPESGFLVKRARESPPNHETVAMAVVDDEFAAKQARDHQIEFVFHRPIASDEARSVLAQARQKMKFSSGSPNLDLQAALADSDAREPSANSEDPNLVTTAADTESSANDYEPAPVDEARSIADVENEIIATEPLPRRFRLPAREVLALALLGLAVFCLWRGRSSFLYLVRTPEGSISVLRQSFAALFFVNSSAAQSVGSAGTESQQDAYFSRNSSTPAAPTAAVEVVSGEVAIPEFPKRLPKAFDFPLAEPEFVRAPAPPPRRIYAKLPDSIRSSSPITPPPVLIMTPAQLLPISTPPPPIPQISEPVSLTEDAARALAVHTVDAAYPREAMAQKLHGTVVLQALVGRDGTVQDVKIARGYFLLGRAAVLALKQWRFRPYTFNNAPVSFKTQITMSFSSPPA
jgi:TonB family protein